MAAPGPSPPPFALEMRDVGLDYPGRSGVLAGVRLRAAPGSVTILDGRSGSGKSSLLAVAAGLVPPSAGTVTVMGTVMDPSDPSQRATLRAAHVGLVFQHLNLLAELTALENVELPLRLAHVGRKEARARAAALLQEFGMARLARQRPSTLSGGEMQRVAIARALATEPSLLLVDEPTSSLDLANASEVVEAVKAAAAHGAAVVVATHDPVVHRAGFLVRIEAGRLQPPRPTGGPEGVRGTP